MTEKSLPILKLAELPEGQEVDTFALLAAKDESVTRTGKPYFRVTFRDATREIAFPIWGDSGWADECKEKWSAGTIYKLRVVFKETSFGPQLDIRKIRPANPSDRVDGFDESMCQARSKFEPEKLFAELLRIADQEISSAPLGDLICGMLKAHRETLLRLPAATRNHHAFLGGFLEHVLSVTRNAIMLVDKYRHDYPEWRLARDLVIAGAILHDIGKLRELEVTPTGGAYTPAGELIGHVLLGRDMLREAAVGRGIDEETLLRLEHIIVSHQRLPEWGSPKPPMTPEALLVHYADDLDAKLHAAHEALAEPGAGFVTTNRNALGQKLFRGLPDKTAGA